MSCRRIGSASDPACPLWVGKLCTPSAMNSECKTMLKISWKINCNQMITHANQIVIRHAAIAEANRLRSSNIRIGDLAMVTLRKCSVCNSSNKQTQSNYFIPSLSPPDPCAWASAWALEPLSPWAFEPLSRVSGYIYNWALSWNLLSHVTCHRVWYC